MPTEEPAPKLTYRSIQARDTQNACSCTTGYYEVSRNVGGSCPAGFLPQRDAFELTAQLAVSMLNAVSSSSHMHASTQVD